MKEAILTEDKQRAHMIVQNANEEAGEERAKILNTIKEKITIQFARLAKSSTPSIFLNLLRAEARL